MEHWIVGKDSHTPIRPLPMADLDTWIEGELQGAMRGREPSNSLEPWDPQPSGGSGDWLGQHFGSPRRSRPARLAKSAFGRPDLCEERFARPRDPGHVGDFSLDPFDHQARSVLA